MNQTSTSKHLKVYQLCVECLLLITLSCVCLHYLYQSFRLYRLYIHVPAVYFQTYYDMMNPIKSPKNIHQHMIQKQNNQNTTEKSTKTQQISSSIKKTQLAKIAQIINKKIQDLLKKDAIFFNENLTSLEENSLKNLDKIIAILKTHSGELNIFIHVFEENLNNYQAQKLGQKRGQHLQKILKKRLPHYQIYIHSLGNKYIEQLPKEASEIYIEFTPLEKTSNT
ncbi:MAG: hypothetical protein KGV48_003010 [Alcaligenaceae bacterium]|nr:hypothetical protein [Alcaligenaceae bacterium]